MKFALKIYNSSLTTFNFTARKKLLLFLRFIVIYVEAKSKRNGRKVKNIIIFRPVNVTQAPSLFYLSRDYVLLITNVRNPKPSHNEVQITTRIGSFNSLIGFFYLATSIM